jgi:Tol biopolymer transport system component
MRRLSNGLGVAIAEGRGLRTVALSLSVLGLAALVVAPAAGAKTRIVWSRFARTGPKQRLVSARPNGTHLQKLTHPGKHSQDTDASISPDGTRVLFERDFLNAEISRVAVVGGNGQNEHPLDLGCVDPCVADLTPTWLPAGDRFAFTPIIGPFDAPHQSASSAVLHTARSNGTDIQRLSQPGIDGKFEDYRARFSRDGSYVVFQRLDNVTGDSAIFRMDPDGSHVRRLTPWKLEADTQDLSPATRGPTKNLVAFETYGHGGPPPGKSSNVATVPSTCAPVSACRKQIRYVTHHHGGPSQSFNPSWSPNGRRIAYVRFRDHPCCVGDIWTTRPDGSHRRPVSRSRLFEYRPDWGKAPRG